MLYVLFSCHNCYIYNQNCYTRVITVISIIVTLGLNTFSIVIAIIIITINIVNIIIKWIEVLLEISRNLYQ